MQVRAPEVETQVDVGGLRIADDAHARVVLELLDGRVGRSVETVHLARPQRGQPVGCRLEEQPLDARERRRPVAVVVEAFRHDALR